MNKQVIVTIGLFLTATVNAQTSVPHNFSAGTPARAAEVNANFDTLETAIDQNASAISSNTEDIASSSAAIALNTGNISDNARDIANNASSIAILGAGGGVPVYAGNTLLGRLLNLSGSSTWLNVISPNGYVFRIGVMPESQPGDFLQHSPNVHFSDPDCSGTAVIGGGGFPYTLGSVFKVEGGTGVPSAFYVPRGTKEYIQNFQSRSFAANNQCTNRDELRTSYDWEVFPNDEAITGVSETPPAVWITLGQP